MGANSLFELWESMPPMPAITRSWRKTNCFQQIVTGEDVLLGKPDAAIYRLSRSRIGIGPEHLLAVEDALSGIRAAVGAGLRCLGIASHESAENLTAAGAARVVADFEALTANDLESILPGRDHGISAQAAARG